ncbi:MAG: hypothetical protein E7231_11535 [Cellulosilyticum sp.]|nr:hypothetical protein [Cellulosilyticum sp.]
MEREIIYKCIVGLSICLVIGIFYYKGDKEEELTLSTFITQLNKERREELEEPIHYQVETLKRTLQPTDFTEEELEFLCTKGNRQNITKIEAIEDVTVLFRALSQSYGGYIYFGGKERFNQAKQEMIDTIENLREEQMTSEVLEQILCKGLDFLVDTHFFINGKFTDFKEQYSYYGSGIDEIKKDAKGYYILGQGKRWYIEEDFEPYIKPTIGEEGQLIYGLFTVVDEEEKEKLPTRMTLSRGRDKQQKEIAWKLCEVGSPKREEIDSNYSYQEISGIPIVSYREMTYNTGTNSFIEDGRGLRNQRVAVLDLRDNNGGSPFINYMWLYQITGTSVYPKEIEIGYRSKLNDYQGKWASKTRPRLGDVSFNYNPSNPNFYKEIEGYSIQEENGYTISYNQGVSWIENETLWFVLVNKDVYSASEDFLRQLETMSNVILVGTNSNGCLTVVNPMIYAPLYLPNSKNAIVYGNALKVANDMEGYDARGTLPDLYIADEDALEAVIRCATYYKSEWISQK